MLLANEPPDNGHVFNDYIDRNGAQGPENTSEKFHHTKTVQRKRFDHSENVHVDVEPGNEGAQKVHHVRTRNRIQTGEDHIRRGQGHRDPRVNANAQQELVPQRNGVRVDDEQDSLKPTFPLLQEVQQRERRFFVHFAFDKVERVSLGEGAHREETIFGHRSIDPVVERDFLLSVDLKSERIVMKSIVKRENLVPNYAILYLS